MKRKILFVCSLALVAGGISAQAIMGGKGKTDIHNGAVLEIVSGNTGGLLLPKVELTNAAIWQPVDGLPQDGMVVYNTNSSTNNNLTGPGAYAWSDGRWRPISSDIYPCNAAPATPGTIFFTKATADLYEALAAYVEPVAGATSYEWTLPSGLIGSSATNAVVIIGWLPAQYNAALIRVKAVNDCGSSAERRGYGALDIQDNTPPPPPPPPPPTAPEDNSGNGSLQGPTCFDIAATEGGTLCGSLNSRKPAFPTPESRVRVYTLSLINSSGITNLRVGYYDDADYLIKSVTGNKAGALSNDEPITVEFADNVNDIVKSTRKSTAKIYAVYSDRGKDKRVELTVTVQDCACCPLNIATIIPNTVYEGGDFVYAPIASFVGTQADLVGRFDLLPNSALCVYNTGNKSVWSVAQIVCKDLNDKNTGEDGWRMPNIAEVLALIEHGFLATNSTQDIYYWSSTGYIDKNQAHLRTSGFAGRAKAKPPTFHTILKVNNFPYGRCVKTISH